MDVDATHAKRTSKLGCGSTSAKPVRTSKTKASGGAANQTLSTANIDESNGAELKLPGKQGKPEPAQPDAHGEADEQASFDRARARTARKVDKSLDATQLYLNEIAIHPCSAPTRRSISPGWRSAAMKPGASG